jgi:hypothetical protein
MDANAQQADDVAVSFPAGARLRAIASVPIRTIFDAASRVIERDVRPR